MQYKWWIDNQEWLFIEVQVHVMYELIIYMYHTIFSWSLDTKFTTMLMPRTIDLACRLHVITWSSFSYQACFTAAIYSQIVSCTMKWSCILTVLKLKSDCPGLRKKISVFIGESDNKKDREKKKKEIVIELNRVQFRRVWCNLHESKELWRNLGLLYSHSDQRTSLYYLHKYFSYIPMKVCLTFVLDDQLWFKMQWCKLKWQWWGS